MMLKALKSTGGGVTKLLVGGYVPAREGVSFTEVSMDKFNTGVALSGQSAAEACTGLSEYECVMGACCSYCTVEYADGTEVGECSSAANVVACNGVVTLPGSCLAECNDHDNNGDECMADYRCGYCVKTGRCVTGKPGTSCEPCEETYDEADFVTGWPHEGRNVVWAHSPPPAAPPAPPSYIHPDFAWVPMPIRRRSSSAQ